MAIDTSEEQLAMESADLLKISFKRSNDKEKYCLGDTFLWIVRKVVEK